jgi:hypothetical protein
MHQNLEDNTAGVLLTLPTNSQDCSLSLFGKFLE